MEVAITTRKERIVAFERPSRSNETKSVNGVEVKMSKSSWVEETILDVEVIYHGVAFLDLTALLYPGGMSYIYIILYIVYCIISINNHL